MKTTTSIALILTTALTLSGCNWDKISQPEKPSEFQAYMERLERLETGMAKKADIPPPAPLVTYVPPPQPTCYPIFRIQTCDADGNVVLL